MRSRGARREKSAIGEAIAAIGLELGAELVTFEGEVPGQDLKDQDSEGPDVDAERVVLLVDDLRRHVARRAAEDVQGVVGRDDDGEPEVDQLHAQVVSDQDVLELHVAVHHALPVAVLQSLSELPSDKVEVGNPRNGVD